MEGLRSSPAETADGKQMKKITWIQIDKRNGILGAVLGALAMLICFSWESPLRRHFWWWVC